MVTVQLIGALQHKCCRPIQGRPRDEEGQRLEQATRLLRAVERLPAPGIYRLSGRRLMRPATATSTGN